MGLIRFLAIAAVIYLLFRIIARFVLPLLARSVFKKASKQMEEQMKQRTQGEKVYQDKDVTIRKTDQSTKRGGSDQDDEYIDFEEV